MCPTKPCPLRVREPGRPDRALAQNYPGHGSTKVLPGCKHAPGWNWCHLSSRPAPSEPRRCPRPRRTICSMAEERRPAAGPIGTAATKRHSSGNAGRSSDSQAQPAVAFSPGWPIPRHNDRRRGKTNNGWMAAGLRRLDTAAGPSRNRTGVPCLPIGRSGDRRATRIQWQSLRNVRALSTCAETGHTSRQVSPTAVGPVKLCRSGKKSASYWSGCRASGRTDYARVTGCISYPAVNVSRLLKNTWGMLKLVSICVR